MRVVGTVLRGGGVLLGAAGAAVDAYSTGTTIYGQLQSGNAIEAGLAGAQFGGRWGGTFAGAAFGAYGFAAGPFVGTATTVLGAGPSSASRG
jgi:hypothetical protein